MIDTREMGFREELAFWRRELANEGHFGRFVRRRLDPLRRKEEVPWWLEPYLQKTAARLERLPRALDVGSGPLSNLAWAVDVGYLEVYACDPLGARYADLLSERGIHYPVTPVTASAEELSRHYEPESFDFVYSRNALDHVEDVGRSLREMCTVLARGGLLALEVFAHEGARRSYADLHAFDFSCRAGRLRCADREGRERLHLEHLPLRALHLSPQETRPWSPGSPEIGIRAAFRRV